MISNTKESIEIWQGCTHCKNKSIEPNEQPCIECFAFNKYEPKTNADRIRNMTDEELADMLFESCIEKMGFEDCKYSDGGIHECKKCTLEWLQAEVKEGAENGEV